MSIRLDELFLICFGFLHSLSIKTPLKHLNRKFYINLIHKCNTKMWNRTFVLILSCKSNLQIKDGVRIIVCSIKFVLASLLLLRRLPEIFFFLWLLKRIQTFSFLYRQCANKCKLSKQHWFIFVCKVFI